MKTLLSSTFTNVLKRKEKISKNVHSCRLSLLKEMLLEEIPELEAYKVWSNIILAFAKGVC